MQRRRLQCASLAISSAALFMACSNDGPLQGQGYDPGGVLPIGPASTRVDGGRCDGGDSGCDGGPADAAPPIPIPDASAEPKNSCTTARAVGSVSGDTGAGTVTALGTCSEWVSFRATEDNAGVLGAGMKVKLTLTMTGGDFDLYVYYDPVRDTLSCAAPSERSFRSGTTAEEVSLAWGEGTISNGSDDVRTIGVAIIKTNGPCGGTTWSLLAEGNR